MYTLLLVFHIIVCILLIIVILLQSGKGGGLASAFGGSGTTEAVFGGRQAATFLSKATIVLGVVFFVLSFTLALISSYGSGGASPVQQELQQSAPILPNAPATQQQPSGSELFESGDQQPAEQAPAGNAGAEGN